MSAMKMVTWQRSTFRWLWKIGWGGLAVLVFFWFCFCCFHLEVASLTITGAVIVVARHLCI